MDDGALKLDRLAEARAKAYAMPLEDINPANPALFQDDTVWPYFERLRAEAPVHRSHHDDFGPYWSITRYNDIMAVDTNHQVFSSEPGITLGAGSGDNGPLRMFIALDPPVHDVQRKTVSPAVSPGNLHQMEPLIRERAGKILDELPIGEEFNWVDKVSMELTAMTLATLFDIPQEDRRKLTYWSDAVTAVPGHSFIKTMEEKQQIFMEYFEYFTRIWNERVNAPPKGDLISMLAHGEATRTMDIREYHGNVILLTVGGNDTTRNTISGSVLALNQNPDQYRKLKENPGLIPSMVSETIRWQTPLPYMRRTAKVDFEFGGQQIKTGDKVAMWYASGNRDETVIDRPNDYIIDRPRPRQHISFGFGIHRCVGNRLAELQLRVIWEEILARFPTIEVTGEPERVYSSFVRGYSNLPVVIPKRN